MGSEDPVNGYEFGNAPVRLGFDEYRGFRHIVRNVYTYKFDSGRIDKLAERAGPLFTRLRAELLAFADFLEANEGEEV